MSMAQHPAVKALYETLKQLPDACDERCSRAARAERNKLRQKRRELRKEVNEMLAEDGLAIEDPPSVDLLEEEFIAEFGPETPELG